MVIPDANVTLISKDEMRVSIPAKAAKFAELVMTSLFDDDDKEEYSAAELELALPNVVGFALEKIVEFLIHYEQNEFALIEDTTPIQPTFSEVSLRRVSRLGYSS